MKTKDELRKEFNSKFFRTEPGSPLIRFNFGSTDELVDFFWNEIEQRDKEYSKEIDALKQDIFKLGSEHKAELKRAIDMAYKHGIVNEMNAAVLTQSRSTLGELYKEFGVEEVEK